MDHLAITFMPQFVLRPRYSRHFFAFCQALDFLFRAAAADKRFSSNLERGFALFCRRALRFEKLHVGHKKLEMKTFCFGDKSIVCSTAVM